MYLAFAVIVRIFLKVPVCAVDSRGRRTCRDLTVNVRADSCPNPRFVDTLSPAETAPVGTVVYTVTTDNTCQVSPNHGSFKII